MATTKTTKTLALACPKCGACDGPRIDLNLNDLDTIACGECSAEFSIEEAVAEFGRKVAAWQRAAKLIEMARAMADEAE